MNFFGAAHEWGGQKDPPLKLPHIPYMMKLGTVKLYLKKIQKLYESRGISLEFC